VSRARSTNGLVRLRDISLPGVPGYGRLAAEAAWREAAGPALAARSRVRLEAPDLLEVRVPDEHWRSTVARLEAALLAALRERVGGEGLRRLRVTVDPALAGVPRESLAGAPPAPTGPAPAERIGGEERLRRIARKALARRGEES
jgi:hypothetical protein